MITIEDIEAARDRIQDRVRRTPVMTLDCLRGTPPVPARVSLKLENLQVTGSFKARGAMNRLLATPEDQLAKGIVTASGGNHGLAVARSAAVAGTGAHVYLPATASPAKVDKLRRWGAEAHVVDGGFEEANEKALAHAAHAGAVYFHPFADPLVVAGQGTVGLEIVDDLPDIDTILVAIGGGGLIAGVSQALRARLPGVRVIGVEPVGAPTLKASLDAGRVVTLPEVTTRVPTMACRRTDEEVFAIVRRNVAEIVLVDDAQMQAAADWLWFETGLAADLSGAASIAVLLAGHPVLQGARHVCALVCGAGPEGVTQ